MINIPIAQLFKNFSWKFIVLYICFSLNICRKQRKELRGTDDLEKLDELEKNLIKRKAQLFEIEQSLPQKNSFYLKVIQSSEELIMLLIFFCFRLLSGMSMFRFWIERKRCDTRMITRSLNLYWTASDCLCRVSISSSTIAPLNSHSCFFSFGITARLLFVNQFSKSTVQGSKAGGDCITLFRLLVRLFYLFGRKESHGSFLERNSCTSMFTLVSDSKIMDNIILLIPSYNFRFHSISSICLSERCPLSTQGSWRTTWYGYNDWRFSFLDVERFIVPSAFPIWRLYIPSVQQLRALQALQSSGCAMASFRFKLAIFGSLRGQYADFLHDCATKTSR